MKFLLALALSMAAAAATPALADIAVFTGDTTGGLTFNRPIANGNLPPVVLSGVGTAVRYEVTDFTVTVSGNYSFFNATNYDSYLGVYSGAFNPASPLVNALAYSDDFNGTLDSGFAGLGLLTGVNYFAVSSGFDNTDFGAFTLTIRGPGLAQGGGAGPGVPEPATWALMIGGFGMAGGMLRRRNAVRA